MKKYMTDSNMWFFAAIMSIVAWFFADNGALWMIFACASLIFGIEAKKENN